MNCLVVFLGETFRMGGQGTRSIGSDESYSEQIKASKSHISFIEDLKERKCCSADVYISTYNTKFNSDLLNIYNKVLIGSDFYDERIGYNRLLHNSIGKIKDLTVYDFVFFSRINICFKDEFLNVFNPGYPNWDKILFPSICWFRDSKVGNHPRVNDMMIYIPKRYYNYIKNIAYEAYYDGHRMWYNLIGQTDLTYDDIDTMLNTYHDSDSAKDFNPIYYIVNRPICTKHHSEGYIFDKKRIFKEQ